VEEYDADSYTPFEYIETFSYQHILKVHNNHSKKLFRVGHGLDSSMDWIGLDWIGSNSGKNVDWIGLGSEDR
jgi:hypothetical protein